MSEPQRVRVSTALTPCPLEATVQQDNSRLGLIDAISNVIDVCEQVGGAYEAVVYNWPYLIYPDGTVKSFRKAG